MAFLEKEKMKITANQAVPIYMLKHVNVENIFKRLCFYLYLLVTKFSCSKYWDLFNIENQKIRFL